MRLKSKYFTLIELLVVIGIIAILLTILLPALKNARDKSKQISCTNQQKQIGVAFNMYYDNYDGFLPPKYCGTPRWHCYYNYIQPALGKEIDYDYNDFFVCPNDKYAWNLPDTKHYHCPSYGVNRRIFKDEDDLPGVKLSQIRSHSNKILIGEPAHPREGSDTTYTYQVYNHTSCPTRGLYFRHKNGCNILWFDGHVEFRTDLNQLNLTTDENRAAHWDK